MSQTGNLKWAAVIFGGIGIVFLFAWWTSLAPYPLPANAPANLFSAHRALEHVRVMAKAPHPGGSHANEAVFNYIVAQLHQWNVETEVLRPIVKTDGNGIARNTAILARIRSAHPTGAFAVDAHFDSTPYGPGAADDVSGCAAMLETIRALNNGPKLNNDLIFCFSDKEEMGAKNGPSVFRDHPWYKDTKAVLGLEARGCAGPALMFETSADNGFLVRQMAKSAANPRANSAMGAFYENMPFGSDFSHLKRWGMPGLNVAYIDNFCYYHTKLDNPANVDLGSLQHHGQYALGLCKRFGAVSLENCAAPPAAYFNLFGPLMVVYPLSRDRLFAIAAMTACALALLTGFLRGRLTLNGFLKAAALFPVSALVAVVATLPLAVLIYLLFQEDALYTNGFFAGGMLALSAGIFTLFARYVRDQRPENLLAGAMLWWAAMLMAMRLGLPGGAYLAIWPLFFFTAGLLILFVSKDPERPSNRLLALAGIAALPAVVLMGPLLVMLTYSLTAVASPAVAILLMLLMAPLLPQLTLLPPRWHTAAAMGLLTLGAALYLLGLTLNTKSETMPRQSCLAYGVNFDTGEAFWLSSDTHPDAWLRRYIPEGTARAGIEDLTGDNDRFSYLRAPAPMPPYGKTILNVLEDRTENGRRFLKLFLDSPRDAQRIHLHLETDANLYNASAFGIALDGKTGNADWNLSLETIPFEGGELHLETDPGIPLTFTFRETSFDLPKLPELAPRPADMMARTNRRLDRRQHLDSEHSYSVCTYTL